MASVWVMNQLKRHRDAKEEAELTSGTSLVYRPRASYRIANVSRFLDASPATPFLATHDAMVPKFK
jgi:hypothetical protein